MAEDDTTALVFDHQCFLMDYSDILSNINRYQACKYKNFHCLEVESNEGPYDALSALSGRHNMQEFVNMTPHQQSLLQPRVRFFKVTPGAGDTEDVEEEFMFQDFTDAEQFSASRIGASVLEDSIGRGGGVGLKEFTWEFDGTNPAEATACIAVSMKLYFQTVHDLKGNWDARAQNPGGDFSPSFLELILIPPGTGMTSPAKYEAAYYKVKAVVGWAPPHGNTFPESLNRALANMQLVMYLNVLTHEIAINEDGSLEVTADYRASLEEAIRGPSADVLFPLDLGGEVKEIDDELAALDEQIAEAEMAAECAAKEGESADRELALAESLLDDLRDERDDLADDREELNDENLTDAYSRFTDGLKDRIRFLDLPNGFINDWEEMGKNERPALEGEIEMPEEGWFSSPSDAAEDADPKDSDLDRIYYIYLGDLVEQACLSFHPMAATMMQMFGGADKPYPLKKMKIVLGPMRYTDARTGQSRQLNLADCPVSLTMFLQFWNEQVIEKQKTAYSVRQFMKDITQQIIKPSLKPGCFPEAEPQSADVSMTAITVTSPDATDVLDTGKRRSYLSDVRENIPETFNPEDPGFQYILYYMSSYAASELEGDPDADATKGVYHYEIGRDRGLVKKIDFSKSDVQGLKEARQAQDGGLSQLREVYNAKVKMVGNNIYIPGMKCFLNPPYGLGDPTDVGDPSAAIPASAANLLGLGGYYDIIKVNSVISRGGAYDTELECIFSHSGGKTNNEDECAAAIDNVTQANPWEDMVQGMIDSITEWFGSGEPDLDVEDAPNCD